MARVWLTDEVRFPQIIGWIRNGLPRVPSQTRIWRAFLEYSHLSEQAARTALQWGTLPQIRFVRMPDLELYGRPGRVVHGRERWGGFFNRSAPDAIFLSNRVNTFGWGQDQIVALVLHELVHWGYFRAGFREQGGQPCRGDQFEVAAYGREMTTTLPTAAEIEADAAEESLRRVDEIFGGPEVIF